MMLHVTEQNRERIASIVGVALFHALLGYALLNGLGADVVARAEQSLTLFDVLDLPPPQGEIAAPVAPDPLAQLGPRGVALLELPDEDLHVEAARGEDDGLDPGLHEGSRELSRLPQIGAPDAEARVYHRGL